MSDVLCLFEIITSNSNRLDYYFVPKKNAPLWGARLFARPTPADGSAICWIIFIRQGHAMSLPRS